MNHMKMTVWVCALLIMGWGDGGAAAQESADGKLSIGIHTIKVLPAIEAAQKARGGDKLSSLNRVAQSMESQLIDRLHNTRKFKVVSRGDLDSVVKDQDLQRVFADTNDAATAQPFSIAGCKYVLVTTVDDFQDLVQELRSEGGGVLATKRSVRLSAVAKIYDTASGVLLETANFQLTDKDGKQELGGVARDGREDEHLLNALSVEMAHRIANRVLDVIYPAKVIAVVGNQVTLNRGDGTGIAQGQVWTVFAVGETLVDPDTGEVLGQEEAPVGKIQITSVTPKFSKATILEDGGIDKLHVARAAEETK